MKKKKSNNDPQLRQIFYVFDWHICIGDIYDEEDLRKYIHTTPGVIAAIKNNVRYAKQRLRKKK